MSSVLRRRRIARILPPAALAVLLQLSGQQAAAQVTPPLARAADPVPHVGAIEEARQVLGTVMDSGSIPGLSAAVAMEGEIVWSEGFGFADLENRVPVTTLSRLRIGSVSKSLTAVALGRLTQEGRLDLDAPVQRYVPEFPEKRWAITTRLLAGHLAGVRHYRDREFLSRRSYDSVREGLAIFRDDTLLFEPGTRYSYSSYGWNLISAVIEGASGEPYLAYMRERVLEPLGMRHTVADHPDSLIAFRTDYYRHTDAGRTLNAPYVDNSYKWAGGGYLSTATDLARFGARLVSEEVLEPATVELLFTSQRLRSGEETGYGIGFRIDEDEAGRRIVGHGGGSVGGTTTLLMYPDRELVVALISNLTGAEGLDAAAREIAGIFRAAAEETVPREAVPAEAGGGS